MAKNDFQYGGWNCYTLQCGTIMTLISLGDCTMQCDTCLWDDMPLNSPKRPPRMPYLQNLWIRSRLDIVIPVRAFTTSFL